MAKYYYEKYRLETLYSNYRNLSSWTPIERINVGQTIWSGYKSFTEGSDVGFIGNPNEYFQYLNFDPEVLGKVLYSISGNRSTVIERKFIERDSSNNMIVDERRKSYGAYDTTIVRGSLLETIEAEDGEYPDNGIQGSFWYVKKGLVFPDFKMKIDGQLKTSENGWVKIDGQLKNIDKIWGKIDGQLKEV